MRKSRAFRRITVLFLLAVIIAVQTLIFAETWLRYYNETIVKEYARWGLVVIFGLYAIIFAIFSNVYGAFKLGSLQFANLVFSQILALIFTNAIIYVQAILLSYPGKDTGYQNLNPAPIIGMTFLNVLACLIWCFLSLKVYKWLYPPRKLLLIYSDRDPDNFIKKIKGREDKYKIDRMIHCDSSPEELRNAIRKYKAVLLCDVPSSKRNDIVKYCYMHDKRAYITPKLSDIIIIGAGQNNWFDSPLLVTKIKGLKWEQAFIKRLMDIVISLIMCVPAIIITIFVAIADLIWDRGPVFYLQPRLTKSGKKFKIIKFRSMKVDSEEKGAQLAKKDDDRITKVGKVLRATHLDELPQVFNVLFGQMSIVGPRPERPEIASQYEEDMPEFKYRLKVKAGLTGYAQVYGKYNTTPYDKLKLDLLYIQNYSFWRDIQLLMMTFKILFIKENREGVEQDQQTAMLEKKRNQEYYKTSLLKK